MTQNEITCCPIPVSRVSEHVGEIIAAVEWANLQSEYGESEREWLWEHEDEAKEMTDRWWLALSTSEQQEWLVRYRKELSGEISWLQQRLELINSQILTDSQIRS